MVLCACVQNWHLLGGFHMAVFMNFMTNHCAAYPSADETDSYRQPIDRQDDSHIVHLVQYLEKTLLR